MRAFMAILAVVLGAAPALAGPASGTVKSPTGAITPKFALGYTVRDSRDARAKAVEVMLSDVAINPADLRDQLDPHVVAINIDALRDRNYVLLWVRPDGAVSMNATYSKTMTQYVDDSSSGLKAEITTNTPTKVEGHVFSPAPIKTMDGKSYTVDVKFSADVLPALSGSALPAGGGDAGKAYSAFLVAIAKKNWAGIKAGLSPRQLPQFDQSYNTPAENLSSAVDILKARTVLDKSRVTGGLLVNPTTAVLEVEGERFGSGQLQLVRMIKTGAAWQWDESIPAGMLK